MMDIRLHYSPDSDDAFMFWALKKAYVTSGKYHFIHQQADTDKLNRLAESRSLERLPEVCAVSLHQYAYLSERYLLLPHGASVGRGYGPVVVSHRPLAADQLKFARIGIPGLRTTAYLVLRLLIGDFRKTVVPIAPFSLIFDKLRQNEIDAALLIHEGRLLYEEQGLHRVLEVGEAWYERTGLPLALGVNVIRKDLPRDDIVAISDILGESIRWGLANREQVMDEMLAEQHRLDRQLSRAALDAYLGMYANQDTAYFADDTLCGMEHLFEEAQHAGLLAHPVKIELVESLTHPANNVQAAEENPRGSLITLL